MLALKSRFGSNTMPIVNERDFSGCRFGFALIEPAICDSTPGVTGSSTNVKKYADDGVISGSDGALKPRPQLARSSHSGAGRYFRPTFGVVAEPKSL